MTTTKASKNAKFTYGERVLSAFYRAQREHKKQTVHMATLRAFVKKTAQNRKDKLGPQWANWVGKSVHKLAEQGVLVSNDSTGHLAMTAQGKKLVASARRELELPANKDDLPSEEEDTLWKTVVKFAASPAPVASPNKRRQSGAGSSPSKRRRSAADSGRQSLAGAPRARASMGGATALSKMTKAELQIALQNLQQEHDRTLALQRETSPLTDIDDEERDSSLQEELEKKRAEIQAVRRELSDVRRQSKHWTQATQASHDEDGMAPEPASHYRTGAERVVRTHSGSLIPQISKHPTPAPSSPGTMYDDLPGTDFTMQDDLPSSQPPASSQQLTPSTSPVKSTAASGAELQKYRDMCDQLRDQMSCLRNDLAAHASELAAKTIEVAREQTEKQTLTTERDALSADLKTITADKDALSTELKIANNKVTTLTEENQHLYQELDQRYQSAVTAETELKALGDHHTQANTRISELESQTQSLQTELLLVKQSGERQTHQMEQTRTEVENSLLTKIQELEVQLTSKSAELDQLETSRALLQDELIQAQEQNTELETSRVQLITECTTLQGELDQARGNLSSTGTQLLEAHKQLHEFSAVRTSLEGQLKSAQNEVSQVHEHALQLESSRALAQNELSVVRANLAAVEVLHGQIQAALDAREHEMASVNLKVTSLETSLSEEKDRASGLASALSLEQARASTLDSSLRQAEEKVTTLETEISVMKGAAEEAFGKVKDAMDLWHTKIQM